MKDNLVQACKKKAGESEAESLASGPRSANEIGEATDQDLVLDSGSTDHVIVEMSWFKNPAELDTDVSDLDGGNTKVLGIGQVEILAKGTQGKLVPLVLWEALFSPGYRTTFWHPVSLTKDIKLIMTKKVFFLPEKQQYNSN